MSFFDALGSMFAPGHKQAADDAGDAIDSTLKPGSAYWKSGDLGASTPGSEANGYMSQAAALGANPISVDTAQMDADAAQQGALASIYRHLQTAGGPMEAAVAAQQGADLANTGIGQLRGASEQSANKVIATAASERGSNASQATGNTASQLAEKLKALAYQAAVRHANIEAGIAAKGAQNSMYNTQGSLSQALNAGALNARGAQANSSSQESQIGFANSMAGLQAGLGALSGGLSTGVDAFTSAASSANAVPTTVAGSNANYTSTADSVSSSAGYALPSVSRTAYVNPITGDTNNASVPVAANNWASWLSPSEGLNV